MTTIHDRMPKDLFVLSFSWLVLLFSLTLWVSSLKSSSQSRDSTLMWMREKCSQDGLDLLSVSIQADLFKLNWSKRLKITSLIDGLMIKTKLSERSKTSNYWSSYHHKSRRISTRTSYSKPSSKTSRNSSTFLRTILTRPRRLPMSGLITAFTLGMTFSIRTLWSKSSRCLNPESS